MTEEAPPALPQGPMYRWRMSEQTFLMLFDVACDFNFNHVLQAVLRKKYYLNMPVTFDPTIKLGGMILEVDKEAAAAASRAATSQA